MPYYTSCAAPLVELQGLLGDPQVEGDAADGEVHPAKEYIV